MYLAGARQGHCEGIADGIEHAAGSEFHRAAAPVLQLIAEPVVGVDGGIEDITENGDHRVGEEAVAVGEGIAVHLVHIDDEGSGDGDAGDGFRDHGTDVAEAGEAEEESGCANLRDPAVPPGTWKVNAHRCGKDSASILAPCGVLLSSHFL